MCVCEREKDIEKKECTEGSAAMTYPDEVLLVPDAVHQASHVPSLIGEEVSRLVEGSDHQSVAALPQSCQQG